MAIKLPCSVIQSVKLVIEEQIQALLFLIATRFHIKDMKERCGLVIGRLTFLQAKLAEAVMNSKELHYGFLLCTSLTCNFRKSMPDGTCKFIVI